MGVVRSFQVGAAPRRTTAIRPAQGTWRRFFQERQHDEHLRLHLPRLRRTPEVRRQGASQGMFCTLCSWALLTTCLPDFLNDATSYRVTVISGDVDNSAHVQAVASLTGLRAAGASTAASAAAGVHRLGIRGRADAGDACRGRTGVQDRAAISVVIHGAPCGQYPREGAPRSGLGRRHLIQAQLDQVQQGPYTRAGRMPMAIHGQQLQRRRPQFQRHSTSRPAARSSWQGPPGSHSRYPGARPPAPARRC